jgi:hypothetical protein
MACPNVIMFKEGTYDTIGGACYPVQDGYSISCGDLPSDCRITLISLQSPISELGATRICLPDNYAAIKSTKHIES